MPTCTTSMGTTHRYIWHQVELIWIYIWMLRLLRVMFSKIVSRYWNQFCFLYIIAIIYSEITVSKLDAVSIIPIYIKFIIKKIVLQKWIIQVLLVPVYSYRLLCINAMDRVCINFSIELLKWHRYWKLS